MLESSCLTLATVRAYTVLILYCRWLEKRIPLERIANNDVFAGGVGQNPDRSDFPGSLPQS